ncbi:hypothetical protein M413DRAFT_13328 [Hebeloma cylindrosporum]|uniref:Uncharacterized protein n=1 Tax=Hebeloma cylindrosporum TaxID=76867 RepID=A0A0C3C231_HEBCY|nr:hypothetical protein M413DRAFT_13328 [Hebeloma cylindrosporum h7]
MLQATPFFPETILPIIIGWTEASPLPPLASKNFQTHLPESCHVLLRILVGPCMDKAGDAALALQLGRLVPDVDCVSITCHASSFTPARKEQFERILPLTVKFREIRVIDEHDGEYIVIKEVLGGFASESYYLTSPADLLPSTITAFGEQNLRVLPPCSAQNFLDNYEIISSQFVGGLKGGNQIQRIGITLDFLPSIAIAFQNLSQHHPNLLELELIEPTTFGLESITSAAAMKLKSALINFLSNSNIAYLTIPLPLITPTIFRSLNQLPDLRSLTISPVKGFCSVPYLCDIARRSVRDFNYIELVDVVANAEDEITQESFALLQTTFPTTIVYQSISR